jgi:hypothetical protein
MHLWTPVLKIALVPVNATDKFPPVDESKQAMFDQGHVVGGLARKAFQGGIIVHVLRSLAPNRPF